MISRICLLICCFIVYLLKDFMVWNKSFSCHLFEEQQLFNVSGKFSITGSVEEKCGFLNQLKAVENFFYLNLNVEDFKLLSENIASQKNERCEFENNSFSKPDYSPFSLKPSSQTKYLCFKCCFSQRPFLFRLDLKNISCLNCFSNYCHSEFQLFTIGLLFLLVLTVLWARKIVSKKEANVLSEVVLNKSLLKLSNFKALSTLLSNLVVKAQSNEDLNYNVNELLHHKEKDKFNKKSAFFRHFFSFPFLTCHLKEWFVYPVFSPSRLASFRPLTSMEFISVSFLSLSEAGFSYSGNDYTILCEGCGKSYDLRQVAGDPASSVYHNHGCTYARPHQVESDGDIQADSSSSSFPVLDTNSSPESSASNYEQGMYYSRTATSVEPVTVPSMIRTTSLSSAARSDPNVPQQTGRMLLGHPSYPIYITLQKRYESFDNWPIPHIQSPRDLAVAGFFYAGYEDCVRCYHCGLGLKSWKLGDDVYAEHEKMRASCQFLQSQRNISRTGPARDHQSRTSSRHNEALRNTSGSVIPSVNPQPSAIAVSSLQADSASSVQRHSQTTLDGATGSASVSEPSSRDLECDEVRPGMIVAPARQQDSQTSDDNAEARAVDKATTKVLLKKENKFLHQLLTCKVCEQAPIKDLFLPCGDLYACTECAQRLTHCPLCNKRIMGTVTVYFS